MPINEPEFEYVRELTRSRAGVVLKEKERFLAEARLTPLAKQNGLGSVSEFIGLLQNGEPNGLHDLALDALLPKDTAFFRDTHPFELLRTHLIRNLEMRRSHENRLRIWCAGCSSGQEPYSIAMVIGRYFSQLLKWDIEIYGTDISTEALEIAQRGSYNKIEVNRGVPSNYLKEFFHSDENNWALNDDLKKVVVFEPLNLCQDWPELEKIDMIFMRNVLEHLTPERRKFILENVRRIIKPDGYLFLGSRETLEESDIGFQMVPAEKSVYFQPTGGF
ncbi:MAG: methyltransferase [Verrucomicrobia bacterium]|nr:methyltransferase [Verrucomicrobiota bacterium]